MKYVNTHKDIFMIVFGFCFCCRSSAAISVRENNGTFISTLNLLLYNVSKNHSSMTWIKTISAHYVGTSYISRTNYRLLLVICYSLPTAPMNQAFHPGTFISEFPYPFCLHVPVVLYLYGGSLRTDRVFLSCIYTVPQFRALAFRL